MSEELLQNSEHTETMADYEEHFDDANPWNVVSSYMEKGTVLPVKVEGIVNGGAIAMVEGLRGFIPASRLSLSYIEDLESYLLKDSNVGLPPSLRPVLGLHFGLSPASTEASMETNWILSKPMEG